MPEKWRVVEQGFFRDPVVKYYTLLGRSTQELLVPGPPGSTLISLRLQ